MTTRARSLRRGEHGYSLVALLAAVSVMLILMAAAMPSWRYLVKNDKEEELIFRGGEIADAILRYQRRNGNALPPSLDILVKGKFLRHPYKDPMTKDGKWRMIRPGEALAPSGANPSASPTSAGSTVTTTTTTTRPGAFSQPGSPAGGFFQGVASTSTDKGLRVFNGRTRYNEWLFLAGQQRVVGQPAAAPGRPGAPAPISPGTSGGAGGIVGIPPNLAPPPPPP